MLKNTSLAPGKDSQVADNQLVHHDNTDILFDKNSLAFESNASIRPLNEQRKFRISIHSPVMDKL
uniref:Uncharacterized protein n=1 Tax=Romanomermis culicivorax TaxID=13658 RepID=A0A915HK02_ROMCU